MPRRSSRRWLRLSLVVMALGEYMEYQAELNFIDQQRKGVYRVTMPIGLTLLAAVLGRIVFPPVAPLFGIVAFGLFYYKMYSVAKIACPKCRQPFGVKSNLVFGVGTNHCQSCGLRLNPGRP